MVITIVKDEEQWNQLLEQTVDDHFSAAHSRVPRIYKEHFSSSKRVFSRHWRHKADIPRDLMSLPRAIATLFTRAFGRKSKEHIGLSRKQKELADILSNELLQLTTLETDLFNLVQVHPGLEEAQWDELQSLLNTYTPEVAMRRINIALTHMAVTYEGGRDAMVFFTLGIVGRSLSHKVAFGSALGIGASAASSLYISQQSFLGGLWASWFGLPAWIGLSGAAAGLAAVVLVTPLLSPFFELGLNKVRSEKRLHNIVDQMHQNTLHKGPDTETLAGYMGTYVQMVPDLIVALRSLKI